MGKKYFKKINFNHDKFSLSKKNVLEDSIVILNLGKWYQVFMVNYYL